MCIYIIPYQAQGPHIRPPLCFSSYMHPESKPTHEGVGSHGGTPVPRSSAQVAAGRMRKAFSRRPIPAKQEEGL